MRLYLFMLLSIWLTTTANAQFADHGKIKIVIINEKVAALENATVELLKAKDSSLVKVAITDSKGLAEFEKIPFGSYMLKASMVNYSIQYSPVIQLSALQPDISLSNLTLQPQATQLSGVTVTSKKPFIQISIDRSIGNAVNSNANAGCSAISALERSSGVS